MINGKRAVVVMPAYNAARTLAFAPGDRNFGAFVLRKAVAQRYGTARMAVLSNPNRFSACWFDGSRRTAISASDWAEASSPS